MHLQRQRVVTVLGHAACVAPLPLCDLQLAGLSIVDELNANTQLAFCT